MGSYFFHSIPLRIFTFVPSYNVSLLFLFTTFIFRKFFFYYLLFPYMVYSAFSIVLIVFPILLFQFPLFRLPGVISSNQSSCLPCPSVNTFSQFVASYFTRIFFAIHSFFLFLTVSLLSFCNFSVSILPLDCLRISVPSLIAR